MVLPLIDGDRRVAVGERVDALDLDLVLVGEAGQVVERRAGDGQPGRGEGEIGAGHRDRGPGRLLAVHVQLAGVHPGADVATQMLFDWFCTASRSPAGRRS